MRFTMICLLASQCFFLTLAPSFGDFTFDGKPWGQAWRTIATDHGEIKIDRHGDTYWDGVRLLKLMDLEYQHATAKIVKANRKVRYSLQGESAHFLVAQVMDIDPVKGQAVTRVRLTPKSSEPKVPRFEVLVTGFNTNPRFDSMQAGEPVTGRMMDLPPPDQVLQFQEYFEAGPLKTDRPEGGRPRAMKLVKVSDNLMFGAVGMPMSDYGLRHASVWAEPVGIRWQVGKPVVFKIISRVTCEDKPRRRATAGARSVTTPRVWAFLAKDPPRQRGDWQFEMLPADRHAPVFTSKEKPRMLVRWRSRSKAQSVVASLFVKDAYSGQDILKIDDLQAARGDDGWYAARVELDVPAGSVYDCYMGLAGVDGVGAVMLGEVVRTARLDQPLISEAPPQWTLVKTIDCTDSNASANFYSSSDQSAVVKGPSGTYRITGGPGDWFGYRFDVPGDAKVMRIEVDYPDDAARDVGVGINEPLDPSRPGDTWGQLRTSSGYFSGLVFPVSNAMRTFEAIYFPNSPWATVEVMNTSVSDRSAPAAVKEVRIYQLEGALPKLFAYDQAPERVFATWTEQGPIAAVSFNTDPSQRRGHSDLGFDPGFTDDIPKAHFFRHWYLVVSQHARYLRYRGDTGYTYGAVMYSTSRYPSKYMAHRMGYRDARYDPAALYAALFGDNGLKVFFNVELSADYRMFQSLYLTDYEVRQGAESPVAVTAEGRQKRIGGIQQTPTLNCEGDLLPKIYSDIVCELAENYGRYPGTAGVVSLSGGIWVPMHFVLNAPLNDSVMAAFAAYMGVSLPGKGKGPDRFAARWKWIEENAAGKWRDYRAVMIRNFHEKVSRRLRETAPHLQYVVAQYGSGYDAYIHRTLEDPLQYELNAGFDPRLYRDLEGVNFTRHYWGIYRALTQPEWYSVFEQQGPLGSPGSPAARFRAYYLNREMAQAFEGHARTSALIHAQFDEHMSWTAFNPDRPGWYRGIHPNIQYPQPVGTDMQFEIALAYAQNTPDDLFYVWADGAVQMGHEPRMQAISAFLRALPVGTYRNDRSVNPPIYVRRFQASDAGVFYAVNTAREPRRAAVPIASADVIKDRVNGQLIAAKDGAAEIELEPFGLRVFEVVTSAPGG